MLRKARALIRSGANLLPSRRWLWDPVDGTTRSGTRWLVLRKFDSNAGNEGRWDQKIFLVSHSVPT